MQGSQGMVLLLEEGLWGNVQHSAFPCGPPPQYYLSSTVLLLWSGEELLRLYQP